MRTTWFSHTVLRLAIVATASTLLISHGHAQMTQADAFSAGNEAGSTPKTQSMMDDITSGGTAATDNIPGYSPTAAQSAHWSNPSAIVPAGTAQIADCDTTGMASTDKTVRNHCEAVQAIRDQPSKRPPGLIDQFDPLLVTGRAITADPESIAGAITGAYTSCTTKTESLGAEKVIETCDEFSNNENASCSIGTLVPVDADHLYKCKDSVRVVENTQCAVGRVIVVDPDANYKCSRTNALQKTYSCDKKLNIVVTWNSSCATGTWIRLATINRNQWDNVFLEMLCDPGRDDGYQRFRTYASGNSGACVGWVEQVLQIAQPTVAKWASLAPHWEHYCWTGYPVYHGAGSCTGNSCTKLFGWGGDEQRVDIDGNPYTYTWPFTRIINPSFTKPYNYHTTTEGWINECSTLEGRAR